MTEEIPVEKLVSRPETRGRGAKYNWEALDIGDSVFLPHVQIRTLASNARIKERHGILVSKRSLFEKTEDGKTVRGVRVWRHG